MSLAHVLVLIGGNIVLVDINFNRTDS